VVLDFGALRERLVGVDRLELATLRPLAALRLLVDPGESEAIVLAYERGFRIILDDRKAREVAQRLRVPVTGTVGLLVKAKQEGVIPLVRPLLDALDAHQFRIGDALRAEALRLAEE
jgi:predicted nucleic acid-binding protein